MTVERITRGQLALDLGYVDGNGNPSARSIAQILRNAMGRWGLSPRAALLKYARDQLRAVDAPVESVPKVLDELVVIGECSEVVVGYESFIAPTEPRWISTGGGEAVLLGPLPVPTGFKRIEGLPAEDLAVRVVVSCEQMAAALDAAGLRQVSLEEWLHPYGFLRTVERLEGGAVRSDSWDLARFWDRLVLALNEDGILLGSEAECRALVGVAGGFFGRQTAPKTEGRWVERPPNGVWCAYRRGYGDNRWLPILIAVDGDQRRSLDLFDHDEWRWAFFARSKATRVEEFVQRVAGEECVSWPLPAQLRGAMNLIGVPVGPWRWRVADDAPDLWSIFT